MVTTKAFRIPRAFPAYIEVEVGGPFKGCDDATAADWRAAKRLETDRRRRRPLNRMVKLADVFGIPDTAPLLPRLRAIASGNVVAINPASARD